MDDYAGRVLADRYRLPLPPSDAYELVETRAFDTYSGQEVLVRQVPLPEVVDAEFVEGDGRASAVPADVRRPADPAVRRAIEAAQAAAQVPDHPRLDQVFDVFAEAGSLWIVSELVASRPLAALLAERPLTPYRAAEIGSDVLTALRVLHAHGWTHRNITARTVLVCDDGRVVLTGLASGAAEEALCGYSPVPRPEDDEPDEDGHGGPAVETGPTGPYVPPATDPGRLPASRGPAAIESGPYDGSAPAASTDSAARARAGAIAAYRAGTRAGARATEAALPPGADDEYGDGPDAASGAWGAGSQGRDDGYGDDSGAPSGGLGVDPHGRHDAYGDDSGAPAGGWGAVPVGRGRDTGDGRPWWDGPQGADGEDEPGTDSGGWSVLPPARDDEFGDEREPARSWSTPPHPRPELPQLPGGWVRDPDARGPYGQVPPYDPEPYDDEDDGEDDDGGPPPRRLHLTGTWDDGPAAGRPVPAGGSREDALRADAARRGAAPGGRAELPPAGRDASGRRAPGREDARRAELPPAGRDAYGAEPRGRDAGREAPSSRWDDDSEAPGGSGYQGPATALAAERARQARIAVVGAVTERWAPEQAGPVHGNWQLAPPIGPATDLWALGALLFRAVQGHAPYPEDSAAELVQMVCGEPPAFAEECGPLRPVVESLLRQDPTERPDVEELSGWLRSLVRSAPEPEAGLDVVMMPAEDATRLPVVRRRGELVRKRRARRGGGTHARHRQTRDAVDRTAVTHHEPRLKEPRRPREPREPREPRALRQGDRPRSLGRTLLVLILLALVGAIAYAVLFMPRSGEDGEDKGTGAAPSRTASAPPASATPEPTTGASEKPSPAKSSGAQKPQTSRSAAALAPGYTLRKDAEGFEVGLPKGWQRSPANAERQVRYGSDGFSVLIVPGRDTAKANGSDPLDYQRDKEPELKPFRDSSWSTASGLRRTDVGRQAMAEGQFTWQDANGREVYVRNLVMLVGGRYHILQVIGPEDERDRITEIYQQASLSYRVTG
ncbi:MULTISPECIES: protein kinase [unclassified Streptomyces]|uniref:protein kinase n=1 Tax=unclassified Streptomyces TaxID=2593676 RepID=UPI002ED2D422|nr:protein kinase [Streptomyces sp. NBC_00891]WSY07287.1 protein kinase [Streptomyces sp. NBC_00890]WSZ08914.1 protein kinase [Streptomyces sp. NBC_00869]WSZ23588.1 protein kinase [Streptomyces sp. NBC_00870]